MTQQFKFGDRVQDSEGKQFIFLRSYLSCCTVASSDGKTHDYLLNKIHPCATEPHPDTVRAAQSEWISVEERLPETETSVLVFTERGYIFLSWASNEDVFWFYNEDENDRVTHWQPLPAPPTTDPDA